MQNVQDLYQQKLEELDKILGPKRDENIHNEGGASRMKKRNWGISATDDNYKGGGGIYR